LRQRQPSLHRHDDQAVEAGAKEFGYPAWRLIAEAME
jgi:hypothetical protein